MTAKEKRAATRGDLVLHHSSGSTRLVVGSSALERARAELSEWMKDRLIFLVHSRRLSPTQERVLEALETDAADSVRLAVPDGEAAKTSSSLLALWKGMLAAGGTRDSRLIAIGGGSVTDVGGFAAATFLRGIELALVPTTLLGQVDAAVGGKTAIDLAEAKNSVGAFWHPHLVVAETRTLGSLDPREWRSGVVEMIKIAAACNPALFEALEKGLDEFTPAAAGRGEPLVDDLVGEAIATKCRIVEADPGESDSRRVLNLGHTLGHAIEAASGYRGLRHGEAVAYGLLFALRLAEQRGADPVFAARCRALVARLDLPPLPALASDALVNALRHDKKARRDGSYWILPLALGRVEIVRLPTEEVEPEIEDFLAAPAGA